MPELMTADGKPVSLDESERAFAAAMAAPPLPEAEHPAPPRRAADAEAPYGRKPDGTPKRSNGGRKPRPRLTDAAPAAPAAKAAPADYRAGLGEFTQGLWMACAATPVPAEGLRLRVRAQAAVLRANADGLVNGVNIMAQHSSSVRWAVEKITTGSAGWVLPAMFALAPFAVQSAAVWRAPDAAGLAELAAQTDAQWKATFAEIQQQMGLAPEQAEAAPPEAHQAA